MSLNMEDGLFMRFLSIVGAILLTTACSHVTDKAPLSRGPASGEIQALLLISSDIETVSDCEMSGNKVRDDAILSITYREVYRSINILGPSDRAILNRNQFKGDEITGFGEEAAYLRTVPLSFLPSSVDQKTALEVCNAARKQLVP